MLLVLNKYLTGCERQVMISSTEIQVYLLFLFFSEKWHKAERTKQMEQ